MSESITNPAIAVFCGSKNGLDPIYLEHASSIGSGLAAAGFSIIYGGGNKGLMGAVANAMLDGGGTITGVIPKVLIEWEHQHEGLTELVITEDMHERKKIMYERCEAAIVLAGGFGTLDEMFEMLTWNQLSIHDKKMYILNSAGFYTHLTLHMQHLQDTGFLYGAISERIRFFDTPEALLSELDQKL
jgi:uncharacterized protein (TIGR00730 family)